MNPKKLKVLSAIAAILTLTVVALSSFAEPHSVLIPSNGIVDSSGRNAGPNERFEVALSIKPYGSGGGNDPYSCGGDLNSAVVSCDNSWTACTANCGGDHICEWQCNMGSQTCISSAQDRFMRCLYLPDQCADARNCNSACTAAYAGCSLENPGCGTYQTDCAIACKLYLCE